MGNYKVLYQTKAMYSNEPVKTMSKSASPFEVSFSQKYYPREFITNVIAYAVGPTVRQN